MLLIVPLNWISSQSDHYQDCSLIQTDSYVFSIYLMITYYVYEQNTHSCVWLFATPWTVHGTLQARILEWVIVPFSRASSQPRQGSNPGLLHCRWILYQLSYQGNPYINAAVANLLGTGDWFCRKQSFHRSGVGGWFGDDSSTLYYILLH